MNKFFVIILSWLMFVTMIGCSVPEDKTILITNVTIIDGTLNKNYIGDVRIKGQFIESVGNLKKKETDSLINGKGLVLSPGFIDTHSHHDTDSSRTKDAAISQGITTIIVGQDGFSTSSIKTLQDSINQSPLSVNIGSYIGHNSVRLAVMKDDYKREATESELSEMEDLVQNVMQQGALGLSTGLEYDPGIYSNTNEVIMLAKVSSKYQGRYISHMRSEDVNLEKSLQEIFTIGKEANLPVQISHFKLARKSLWGKAPQILKTLDSARAKGINVTADIYPYQYWQSTMTVLFPKRDFDNRASATFALTELTSPKGMIISDFNANKDYEGLTLDSISKIRNEDPITTYMELIKLSQEIPGESIIAKSMDARDIKAILNWPYTNLCSDGAATGHPRGWGAFTKFLNMDTGQSLEEKIHTMTQQAANNLNLKNIGVLKKGYYADLVLFDPKKVKDKATFSNTNLRSEGIYITIVSGKVVYFNNQPTNIFSGRFVNRIN